MKFEKIEIQNFLAIKYAEVELDNQGLVLIKGCNEDNPSFQSNGAGKSSIIESIVYVLFGKTIRGLKADEIVNKTSKCNCKVSLDLIDDDGSRYKITRYRKHKTHKNSVFLYHNTEDITPKSELDLNKEIVRILQTDYLTFTSSILYSSESFKFTQASDAEMKQAFEVMLDLGVYSRCQDEVKSEISEVNVGINEIQLKITSVESKIQILEESQQSLLEKSKNWKQEQEQEAAGISEQIVDLKQQLGDLQESVDDYNKNLKDLEKSLNEKELEIHDLDKSISEFSDLKEHLREVESSESDVSRAIRNTSRKIEDYQSDITSYERKMSKLEKSVSDLRSKLLENEETIGTPCPVCGRPLEPEHVQDAINEIQSSIDEHESEISDYQKKIQNVNSKIEKLQSTLQDYQELLEEVESEILATKQSLEKSTVIESKLKNCNQELRVLESSKLREEKAKSQVVSKIESLQTQIDFYNKKLSEMAIQENPYEVQIQSERAKVDILIDEQKSLKESVSDFQHELDILQFWLKGFSNSGIKSMLLDDITPFLNERANKYLQVLSGSHVHVEFSTQTPLKSGELREKFQIRVVNDDGGDSYMSNSSGEKRRIDVAINLALQDLIASRANKKLNIMFLDEILDTLDRSGTDSVIGLLAEIAKEKSSVFVISHNEDIQSYFQNFLVVTKKDGCSSVEKVVL